MIRRTAELKTFVSFEVYLGVEGAAYFILRCGHTRRTKQNLPSTKDPKETHTAIASLPSAFKITLTRVSFEKIVEDLGQK